MPLDNDCPYLPLDKKFDVFDLNLVDRWLYTKNTTKTFKEITLLWSASCALSLLLRWDILVPALGAAAQWKKPLPLERRDSYT